MVYCMRDGVLFVGATLSDIGNYEPQGGLKNAVHRIAPRIFA